MLPLLLLLACGSDKNLEDSTPPLTTADGLTPDYSTTPTWDCADLPEVSLLELVPTNARANEDIAMDVDGNLIGADEAENLWKSSPDGETELIIPNSGVNSGLRLMWWNGQLVAADRDTGTLNAIDPATGGRTKLLGGLAWPNGIEIGADRTVWFTEFAGARVSRFDPATDERTVIDEGIESPNGLAFNAAYDRLYIVSNDDGNIYALDIDPATGEPTGPRSVFASPGIGVDGLYVDACDNLYAGWWSEGKIARWTPDGQGPEVLISIGLVYGLGNWVWGRQSAGWSPTKIYVVQYGEGTVLEVELGVGSKPRGAIDGL